MMRKIPKEHEDAMIEAYLNGATQEDAAALFGYRQTTCARALKRRGIIPRSAPGACRTPKEHEDAMIIAYLAGATQEEAFAQFGYDKTTCSNILKRNGIAVRERRIPKDHEEAIIAAYLAGATQEDAASLFGYDGKTCANILKRRSIIPRSSSETSRMPKEHEDGIIAAYLGGASAERAAAEFGYTDDTCFNVLKRRGITPRSHAEACGIPPEHEDAIVAAYLAGATQAEAAALFGYNGSTCLNALKRRGIVPRSHTEVCHIPPEHEDAIVTAYLAGSTQKDAAALFGYSGKACLNALKRRGIIPRGHSEACSIPPEHEDAMIAAYLAGSSTNEAAALSGHNGQTCTNVLKRRGLVPRTHAEVCRRYSVDESFFDCINTEEKAYWLGFLTSDGGIVGPQIILQLQIGDINHIRKFITALHSEHPVSTREVKGYDAKHPVAHVAITSVKLVHALQKLGVGEKKSHIVRPCREVPEQLLNSYWRGIFDGDGCITYSGQLKPYWQVSLVGNYAIVEGFRDFMCQFVTSNTNVKPHKSIFRVQYNGLACPRQAAYVLYKGATVYLDRKYALAKQLCGDLL